MRIANVYTRKITGIDYRVWETMLVCWIVCLALFGYTKIKSAYASNQPCSALNISVDNKESEAIVCNLNRLVIFRIQTQPGARVEWDFDDGTKATGPIVSHSFAKESIYKVTAFVNNMCKYETEVTVKSPIVIRPVKPDLRIFGDSSEAMIGSQIRFSGVANFAIATYEWKWLEKGEVQNTEIASFKFDRAGTNTVQLIVNNDQTTVKTKKIEIKELPLPTLPVSPSIDMSKLNPLIPNDNPSGNNKQPPHKDENQNRTDNNNNNAVSNTPENPKATAIDPNTFKDLMQAVLDEEKDVSELYQYLEFKETTTVQEDDDKNVIKLSEFCKKRRNRKIESLELKRNEKNFIQKIEIKLKKQGILKKIFGKKG